MFQIPELSEEEIATLIQELEDERKNSPPSTFNLEESQREMSGIREKIRDSKCSFDSIQRTIDEIREIDKRIELAERVMEGEYYLTITETEEHEIYSYILQKTIFQNRTNRN